MQTVDDFGDVQQSYRDFAREEVGLSACFAGWAEAVAEDPQVLDLLATLPAGKRQPNLVFAAARWHGSGTASYADLRATLVGRWQQVRATVLARSTQTNEVGRCATLLPLLSQLPQPLALLEVGASAGLCLFPDRYSYRYSNGAALDPADGVSPVVLPCEISGPVPLPQRLPEIAWRVGIDLNPLDITDEDDVRWLETLVWPEHDERRARLAAAINLVRGDPPRLIVGDLLERVIDVAATAPTEATLVVFHSAVLSYLPQSGREAWVELATVLPGHWISNEAPNVLPSVAATAACAPPGGSPFALGLDGLCVAWTHGHGRSLRWCGVCPVA